MKIYQNSPLDTRLLKRFALLFVLIMMITMMISIIVQANALHTLKDIFSGGIAQTHTELEEFWHYLFNNAVKVPLLTLLVALIPLPFIYIIPLLVNAAILGIALSIPIMNHQVSFWGLLLGAGINGVPEILAILITIVSAAHINRAICQRLYRQQLIKIRPIILAEGRVYVLYTLPLFLIAAVIEAFLVPML